MFWYKRFRWRLRAARAVRAQVRSGVLPEVRETFTRLRAAGLTERQAYRLVAAAYEAEMTAMILENRVYDRSRYMSSLQALPTRPPLSFSDIGVGAHNDKRRR
jgi:hypothetical protein